MKALPDRAVLVVASARRRAVERSMMMRCEGGRERGGDAREEVEARVAKHEGAARRKRVAVV